MIKSRKSPEKAVTWLQQGHRKQQKPPQLVVIAKPEDLNASHYEYLYKARSATPLHYEVVYQEISDEEQPQLLVKEVPKHQHQQEALRPIEGLPDIIGNVNMASIASSASDNEVGSPNLPMTDSFKPASFFLNQSKKETRSASS